jgi:hypothetical protein
MRKLGKTGSHKRVRLSVVPKAAGWAVHGPAPGNWQITYKTRREAVAAARGLLTEQSGGEVVILGRDGRIRSVDTYALGGDGFDKISAVEGIFITEEMKRDFRALDSKRLSPERRRQWLIAKYGSRRDGIRREK